MQHEIHERIYFLLISNLLCELIVNCSIFLYFLAQFSGFPFSSEDAKLRLRTLSRLGLLWTSARLGWGIVALTTVVEGWLNEAQKSTWFYTVVLVSFTSLSALL